MTDPQQNPQQAVDDALATPAAPPSMASLPPQPVATPEPPASLTPPPTMTELPVESPALETPVAPVIAPSEPVVPVVTTTTTTSSAPPMGDETPLAFAAQAPVTPAAAPPTTTTTTTTLAEPVYVPPAQDVPKPKAGSKIMMTLLGIFALLATLAVGGYYAYLQFGGETATVAEISQSACHGCSAPVDGGWRVWRDGRCRVTGICNSSKPDKNTDDPSPTAPPDDISCTNLDPVTKECRDPGCSGLASDNYAFCGGCVNKCVSKAALAPFGGCRDYVSNKCGTVPVVGASCASAATSTFFKKCDTTGSEGYDKKCPATGVYFDRTGSCYSRTGNPSQEDGLCAVYANAGNKCSGDTIINSDGTTSTYTWVCDATGCRTTDVNCFVRKYTCTRNDNLGDGCQDNPSALGKSQTFSASCGAEQIDVACNGAQVDFRSKIYPTACGTTKVTGPTLVCNSLTKNVADAAITLGSPITLTCAGTVTPTSAGTLSYQFRYMVGTGAWQNLTATGNTATLTPTQCGAQYTAQCRACATLNGVNQCDPVWQGVAP